MFKKLLCILFGHKFEKVKEVVYTKIGREVVMKTQYVCKRCGKEEYRDE
jgi:hypothetical protein